MNFQKKLVAGFAGVVLVAGLAGTSSFALWSDSASMGGAIVKSGNLQLETVSSEWLDITEGLPEGPRTLTEEEINGYTLSPGDTLRMSQNVDLALDGANLQAQFDTTGLNSIASESGATITVSVLQPDGAEMPKAEDGTILFYAENNRIEDDSVLRVPSDIDGISDVRVVVDIHLPVDAFDGGTYTETTLADFENAGIALTQKPLSEN